MSNFDIKSLAIASTGTMPIRDVDGEIQYNDKGEELSITFHSPGTREFAQAKHEHEEKLGARLLRMQGGKGEKSDPDQDLKSIATFLAKVTVSLNGFKYDGGPKALYEDRELGHITEAANKFLGERGNFKRKSGNDSSNTSATLPG